MTRNGPAGSIYAGIHLGKGAHAKTNASEVEALQRVVHQLRQHSSSSDRHFMECDEEAKAILDQLAIAGWHLAKK